MTVHVDLDELADAAAGVLDDERTEAISGHVRGCTECRESWSALASVSRRLATEPPSAMPAAVSRRLSEVLATESAARTRAVSARAVPTRPMAAATPRNVSRPSLGTFGTELARPSRTTWAPRVLAACAAAGLVGFGGYVLSAAVGLNEPTETAPAVISSTQLGREARAIESATDLDPHRFSKAWRCARSVTTGRITGLTPATFDGQPALLVYTRVDDSTWVTVVSGCRTGAPTAGPSTTVPR